MKSSNISITLSHRLSGFRFPLVCRLSRRIYVLLIFSFLLSFTSQGQDCTQAIDPTTTGDTGSEYTYNWSSIDMGDEEIKRFKVDIYEDTLNTIVLRKTGTGSEPYNLNIFLCGVTEPIHTVTAYFNQIYEIPDNIFSYSNCSGEFLLEVFHVQEGENYDVTVDISTNIEDCPSTATINLSDPNANTNEEICTNDPDLLISLNNVRTASGSLITNTKCLLGGGVYFITNGIDLQDTLALNSDGEAILNPSTLSEGLHSVRFVYYCSNGTDSMSVAKSFYVNDEPNATFQDSLIYDTCRTFGVPIILESYLSADANIDGTFRILPPMDHSEDDTLADQNRFYPNHSGLYMFEYTSDYSGSCNFESAIDTLRMEIGFKPNFTLTKPPLASCQGSQYSLTVPVPTGIDTMGNRYRWFASLRNLKTGVTTSFGSKLYGPDCPDGTDPQAWSETIDNPGTNEAELLTICLEVSDRESCYGTEGACPATECISYYIYNDANNCNCVGPSYEVCYANDQPNFRFSCFNIDINFGALVVNQIVADSTVYSCSDETILIDTIHSDLFDVSFSGGIGGKKIEDLGTPISDLCGFFGKSFGVGPFTFTPFKSIYDLIQCDATLSSVLIGYLTSFAQGNINQATINGGPSTFVVADTDGDGAFDFAVNGDTSNIFSNTDLGLYFINTQIPNNVDGNGRKITLRAVSGFPVAPRSHCGAITATGQQLSDLFQQWFGKVPFLGDLGTQVFKLSCDTEMSWTKVTDKEFLVTNNNTPSFISCPSTTIKILEDFTCASGAVWPIPLASDACSGDILPFDATVDSTDVINDPSFTGVYHYSGFNLGDSITQGTHTITYKAKACNGIEATCNFQVEVGPGDPLLQAPNDIVFPTDYGYSSAIVTGIGPLSGIGCSTTITYDVYHDLNSIPISTSSTAIFSDTSDASGHAFPLGNNKIIYSMNFTSSSGTSVLKKDSFILKIVDNVPPVPLCGAINVQIDETGSVTLPASDLDGGSFDNVTSAGNLTFLVHEEGVFQPNITFDCDDKGFTRRTLKVTDGYGNSKTCIAEIDVLDYFHDFEITMDLPELCLEATNPEQLNFSNYLNIVPPNSTASLNHSEISTLGPDIVGNFFISAFIPAPNVTFDLVDGTSPANPGTQGYLDPDTGEYTPGTGTGYVTITYLLYNEEYLGNSTPGVITGCHKYVHETFELRQPLELAPPTCACGDFTQRFVDLGVVEGGLEPYTIQFSGGKLDINSDGSADDITGEYTYSTVNGHNISNFEEDLGQLLMDYSNSDWSITIVDARGCEVFRSGSCDNIDVTSTPEITCPPNIGIVYTDEDLCSSLQEWTHPDIFSGQLADNCVVDNYIFYIKNADGSLTGPNDLSPLLNIDSDGNLDVDTTLFSASHHFPQGVSTVNYYAEDATGNFIECSFTVTVEDGQAPSFYNCPSPPTVENTETNHCDAYVNFALPIAEDNCDIPTVVQIDNTGLTTGDRFPAGTTIMYWEAIDNSGNKDTCQVKVVVNDYWNTPEIECVEDVISTTEDWSCEAQVYNLKPEIDGICLDNFSVTYEIFSDETHTNRIGYGVWDASGEYFEKGDSWLKYTIKSQPLLLISEISQSEATDEIELVNLGPAAIDISCLEINRTATDALYSESLPLVSMLPSLAGTIIEVGDVLVFEFTSDAPADMGACYTITYMDNPIDQVAVNNYAGACNGFTGTLNSGNVYRIAEADSDHADDWRIEEDCHQLTIGDLNDELEAMPDNGTTTSLQSEPASHNTCDIQITIIDDEEPFCGELASPNTYFGSSLNDINNTQCNQSNIVIPINCIIGQMTLNMTGTATPANSKITLLSPDGFEYAITELPYDLFDDLYTLNSFGIWTIEIEPNTSGTFTMDGWNLETTCMNPFSMSDTSIDSEPNLCGAQLDWTHPWFVDNCIEGSISVTYTTDDAESVPDSGTLTEFGGYDVSEFFAVGTTTVTYTLVDETGNDHECSFDVIVNDIEDPVIICPDDISIELEGGACDIEVCFEPTLASDNCTVVDTLYSQDPCTAFEIGVNVVTITAVDVGGNTSTCNFDLEIIEYVPANYNMVCNDLVNIALDVQCEEDITADMILEGNGYHCYEDYEITVTDLNGFEIPNSPTIDIQDVGENFLVMVYDPDSGNFCWGEISIQDHANPVLDCPEDATVTCLQSTAYGPTGQAVLTSCEASVDWQIDDDFETFDSCDEIQSIITRTITVVDESGNSSNCVQTITVERILLEDVTFPGYYDGVDNPVISCALANSNPNATSPSYTGRPKVGFVNLNLGPTCGLSVNMSDEVFDLCDGSYDILRTWSVYDGCQPPIPGINPITYTQLIKVVDKVGPSISCPPDETVSVDYLIGCNIDYQIPAASVSDACSDYEVITTGPFGSIYGNGGTLQGLPQGTFEIEFQAIDDCNNKSFCEYNLTVVDSVSPAMICIQQKEIVLNSGGYAEAHYESFDLFSFDNCCLESIDVKRPGQAYGESVSFDCNDDIVIVTLRGIDCYGNVNTCISEVNVEDKTGPQLDCPANETILCDIYYTDYAADLDAAQGSGLPDLQAYAFLDADFGTAQVTDNCDFSLDMTMEYGINQCGEGSIVRSWTSVDPSGNEAIACSQTITIEHNSDWNINFPEDWSGELNSDCSIPDIVYGEAVVEGDNCEMIAISYADEPYLVSASGCYKIVRTWTAINWCTYDGALSQENGTVVSASDNIYNVTGSDFISHTQTLDIYDTQAPVIEDMGTLSFEILDGCDTDFELPAPVILEECTDTDYNVVSTDLIPYGTGTSYANVPEGSYTITYGVSDACGNISFLTTTVEVSDGKKPTPYCVDELVVEIMPDGNGDGMAMVNAADFDAGSFDNCTDQSDLILSLSSDITQSTQEFDCSNVGIQTIELHVWDEAGNVDFCLVSLDIQDNMDVCAPGSLTVAGTLITEMDEAVESATIQINGGLFTTQSAQDGSFLFDQLPEGGDYSLVPGLDLDPDNGVTTFDIVLVTRHILGIESLNSPYKIIAADANNSGSVSTLDVVNIRKVILGIDANFLNNTSWRFVDESYDFPNPMNPWSPGFPEVVNFNNLAQDSEATFIGIKVGDVNGSAQSHSLIPAEELDGEHPFIIQTDDQQVIKGKTYSVNLRADQVTMGFQFTLNFDSDKLKYIAADAGLMNEEHIGLSHLEYGAITCSWNDNKDQILNNDELISFEFEALKDGLLSDMISINSRITKAEAYSSSYPLQEVALMIGDALADNIELYQNVPNPFKGQTRVNFYLPDHSEATLSVRDLNGKLVAEYSADFSKGNNTLIIKDIPKGVFYYTLSVDRYLITRKMVKL